jgi:putative ABC transport system permease protein
MNAVSRGIRNAFRNTLRTGSIVAILGLSMGLALAMLIANKAVSDKITSVKSSVGNTVSITPAGFSGFSSVNNALTTSQLSKVTTLSHVESLSESLTARLTTIGSTQPSFGGGSSNSSSSNTTSLTSPVTLNFSGGGGRHLFAAAGGSLPTNFSPPITIIGTTEPSQVDSTDITIAKGSNIDGSKNSNDALVSSEMASKNNLSVGSNFTAINSSLTVTGIFSASTSAANNDVIVSLPELQSLTGQSGDVTSATATIDSLDNLNSATTAIKNSLGSSADVVSAVTEANQTVQPLNSVKSISLYSLIGAIVAGGIIILLTMVMIVRERTREIGVIKAIGSSNLRIAIQFMTEAVTLTLMGAVVGMILASVAAQPITKLLVSNTTSTTTTSSVGGAAGGGFGGGGGGARFVGAGRGAFGGIRNNFTNIHAAVGWSIIAYGFLAAIVIALIGSGVVSLFISKVRPAEVLRSE